MTRNCPSETCASTQPPARELSHERNRQRCGVLRCTLATALFAAIVPAIAQQFSVTITSPTNGATFSAGANIPIAANATSRDGVTMVEFFQGSVRVGVDTTTPYSATWSNVPAGNYSLTAKMTDSKGRIRTSAPVSIAVNGTAPPPPPPSDPRATTGEWSPLAVWPDVAIHLHLLPDGKVLSYSDDDHIDFATKGTRAAGKTRSFIVTIPIGANPSLATWWEAPNTRTNLFCSGHSYLPDGRLLIMGGHDGVDHDGSAHTTIFDWRDTMPWDYNQPSMSGGRWYPTAVTMANGEVLVVSGEETHGNVNRLPEVWQTNSGGGWRPLTTAVAWFPNYPFLHAAPNGRVFNAGPTPKSYYLDTRSTGFWSEFGTHIFQAYRDYGSSVMYLPGKVLVVGGGDPPTPTAEVIDLNAASPAWRSVASMSVARRHLNATILADGTVLVTGGTSAAGSNNAAGAVYHAELWDPATEQWRTLASSTGAPRLYHSAAILLQDGRVLSAGGGRPAATGSADQENAEIFSPPYLFKGTRPTISSAPTASVAYGQTFFLGTPDAANIAKVTLVRLSSATHALNMNQRFNGLQFAAASGGLNVVAPAGATLAPPGHYLLFIINSQGVPSVARTIQLL
jgi:hypothetical protein